jgi:hypothetical protein
MKLSKRQRNSFKRYVPRQKERGAFGTVLLALGTLLLIIFACGTLLTENRISTQLGLSDFLPTALAPVGLGGDPAVDPNATPLPRRGPFTAGEPLPYTTQSGDYVESLAAHFNTTPEEILAANPSLPVSTTLPIGLPIGVPSYYTPLIGPTYKMLPDSEFVYGPAQRDFDPDAYLATTGGSFKDLQAFAGGQQRTVGQTLTYVAQRWSINPRLLIALAEWRSGAVTGQVPSNEIFGPLPRGVSRDWYPQMTWMAEQMSVGYYGWRIGDLTTLMLPGDYTSRIDFYQNAGTVGLQYLFSQLYDREGFERASGPVGFGATYRRLFGNPWPAEVPVLTGELVQPPMALPFAINREWNLTGGPHPAWGRRLPWGAIDFAPAGVSGCASTSEYALAVGDGVIARAGENTAVLDLDGDGYEGTGWIVIYFHMAEEGLIAPGARVSVGDPIGNPSCEGGSATGTHLHISRRYNGEWLPAGGIVPFNLGGWIAQPGPAPYLGRLTRTGAWVEASTVGTAANRIYWVDP